MKTAILFLLLPTIIYAQTNVSGFISTNTTWTLSGSPYIVIGNTLVSHGSTLTIEPGVVVKFNADKALQIDGELLAIGTPQSRIKFTSNLSNPSSGDWAKIHFSDTCVSAAFDLTGNYLSGSIMKYCDVEYAGSLGIAAIHIVESSPYFTHCNISNSAADGIYSYETTYLIDSSFISNCQGSGLHFERYFFGNSCTITIQDNSILNNTGGGIKFDGYYGGFPQCNYNHYTAIRRNIFDSNSPFALIAPGSQNDSLIVSENIFTNNTGSGATLQFSVTTYLIECNQFINNNTSGGIIFSNYGDNYAAATSSFHIRNNIFRGNTVSGNNKSIIHLTNNGNDKDITISNNLISNNSSPSGQICSFTSSITCIFQIHDNSFIGNTSKATVEMLPPNGTGSSYTYLSMTNNNLVNPNSQYEFKNSVPYGSPNLTVSNNYWGTTSTQHLDAVIYDFFDLANQSVVYYQPLLDNAVTIDTSCFPLTVSTNNITKQFPTVNVYPNPFTNQFTVQLSDNGQTTILLYNFVGQQLWQQTFTNSTTINTEQLADGIYFYELRNDKGVIKTGKVVKQ